MKTHRILVVLACLSVVIAGAWAIDNQNDSASVSPADFDPGNESDYPVLTDIDIDFEGLGDVGEIYMIEGIENMTAVDFSGSQYTAGPTSYSRLVMHGVFDKIMRDWRDDIIGGTTTKHDIELDLNNKAGKRVLRITFSDTFPVSYSIPPLSVDNNTRYMERIEFVYTDFEITN